MRLARHIRRLSRFAMATLAAGTLSALPAATAHAAGNVLQLAAAGGTSNLAAAAGMSAGTEVAGLEISPAVMPRDAGGHGVAVGAPTVIPNPAGSGVTTTTSATGFDGLNHRDQRFAGTGAYANTNYSSEPPDQALCVGNGFIVEGVNTAMQVFDTSGHALTAPTALNQFFHRSPAIDRTTLTSGDFLSDPKCIFDADTGQFFLTVLENDTKPKAPHRGSFVGRDRTLIAVTAAGDPTGTWNLFSIDTTDDGQMGTPNHPNCPCLGDQPLIGTDANGFYVTTNEFGPYNDFSFFNGAQVYAMSKRALASGTAPTVVHIDTGVLATPDAGGIWYTLQPALNVESKKDNGTEWFLSALDFFGTLDNRLAVWTLTNTASLNTASPSVSLSHVVINTETYGQPPVATQKDGPPSSRPYGYPDPAPTLNTNDDRMNQVVYADGKLWGGVNTVIGTAASQRAGIAWFAVNPQARNGSSLSADSQGYVALANEHVMFPSIAVGQAGAVMTFSVSGPDHFPSAGLKRLNDDSPIEIIGAGSGPADGFTGYAPYGPPERWGDYSAAVSDAAGNVWLATEYIGPRARSALANWGTYIAKVGAER
jgi:hypothetical protein